MVNVLIASSGEFSVSDQSVAGIYNVTLTAADDVASTACMTACSGLE